MHPSMNPVATAHLDTAKEIARKQRQQHKGRNVSGYIPQTAQLQERYTLLTNFAHPCCFDKFL